MRVAVTGASGLVGTALSAHLRAAGHEVIPMVRKDAGSNEILWDPKGGTVGPGLDGLDGLVHLAGAGIADGRWTDERKREIMDSRVLGTRTLVRAMSACERPPRAFVSTSAIGYYGDRGDEVVDEDSPPGTGFLAEVCKAWEAEARPAPTRTAIVRTGLVLSREGGALGPLLPVYRAGLGGPIGGGHMWQSFIAIDDLVRLYTFLLEKDVTGPFNGAAPNPVTQREFAKALGRAVHRPAIVPAPALALKVAMGEMSAVALESTRVRPKRTLEAGFEFQFPDVDHALAAALA